MSSEVAHKATPAKDLRDRIMNPCIPKTEPEHWASRHIAELESENAKLKVFARWALAGYAGGFPGDLNGEKLQEAAEKTGLLSPHKVTESCGNWCYCDEFPTTCYRLADWLKNDG